MVRTPSSDKNGLKRGSWSEEEDNKLRAYIQKYGHWNWRQLPKFAGLSRCGKSCRLRWMNYLRPDVKRGNYSKEEEHMIMKLHEELGNKWSAIAAHLPGRTDNEIKNFWHTYIKKRGKSNPTSEVTAQSDLSFKPQPNQKEQFEETSNSKANDQNIEQAHESDVSSDTISLHIFSSSMSTNLRSTNWDAEDGMAISSLESFAGPLGNFWSEPFLEDTFYYQNYYSSPSREGGLMSPYLLYDDDAINLFHH